MYLGSRIRLVVFALAMFAVCFGAIAADKTIVVGPDGQQLTAGKYWAITLHQDGSAPAVSLAIDVGGGPNPPVPPEPVSDLAKNVVAAVNKLPANDARHSAAMKLAAVCQVLGEQVGTGKIHPTDSAQAFQLIGKAALAKDATTWGNVLGVIESALTKATTADAAAKVLNTAGSAVLSTVPDSSDAVETMTGGGPLKDNQAFKALAEKYGFDWNAFLQFVMQLLTLLLPLITWAPKAAVALLFV